MNQEPLSIFPGWMILQGKEDESTLKHEVNIHPIRSIREREE